MGLRGAYRLSDLTVAKVGIRCECGLARRYDRLALMEKVGDHDLPSFLRKLAAAEGCEKTRSTVDIYAICRMGYASSCIIDEKAREAAMLREKTDADLPPRS